MSSESLRTVVLAIINRLASGDFNGVVQACAESRLTAEDLAKAVRDYGRVLVEPPPGAYQDLDAIAVRDARLPTWSVWAPLWSREEGRSDLTLGLTVTRNGARWEVELDDLHVL